MGGAREEKGKGNSRMAPNKRVVESAWEAGGVSPFKNNDKEV